MYLADAGAGSKGPGGALPPPPGGPVPPLRPMEDADANKSAAQRLRERIAGKKHGASGAPAAAAAAKGGEGEGKAAGAANGGADRGEGAEGEEGLPRQRRRTAADEDVSTAAEVADVAAGAVEEAEGEEGGGAMVVEEKEMGGGMAPEPVGDEDVGTAADWTFAELQNMAVRPDGEGLGEEAEEAAAEGVEVSEEEALEALAGHVGPDEEGSEVEVSGRVWRRRGWGFKD